MAEITALKDKINTKTLNLVLLSIATGGIFPLLWLYKHCPEIEDITGRAISDKTYIIWIAVCVGVSAMLAGTGETVFDVISTLISLASAVLYIVWAFKAKNMLQEYALHEHKVDLRMNGFYTFVFNVYYINYCINDLPEAQRKQQILSGQQPQTPPEPASPAGE